MTGLRQSALRAVPHDTGVDTITRICQVMPVKIEKLDDDTAGVEAGPASLLGIQVILGCSLTFPGVWG